MTADVDLAVRAVCRSRNARPDRSRDTRASTCSVKDEVENPKI